MLMRRLLPVACAACISTAGTVAAPADDQILAVFDEEAVEFDKTIQDGVSRGDVRLHRAGQQIERTIDLPALPTNQRDARRIVATLIVEPVVLQHHDKVRPADPWTRLGSVTIAPAGEDAAARRLQIPNVATIAPKPASQPATQGLATQPSSSESDAAYPATTVAPGGGEIEIMRFVTPFGGPATFTADITALAPLLSGPTSVRVWISTWKQPAWKVTLTLAYTGEGAGYRRPAWAKPLFNGEVTAERRTVKTEVVVPGGLARPRVHLLSTGHATDGAGGDEFISRTHVLRIDGVEVARWRPWSEDGGGLRLANPTSGRTDMDGRSLWASDLDRSGWHPGRLVEPMRIPLPELTTGTHTIELEILSIRPKDQSGHGYWRVSAIAVADEPWPNDVGPGPN